MTATFPRQSTLRQTLERAAGMHPAPQPETRVTLFGACDSEAHGRCDGCRTVGVTAYRCSCECHAEQAADYDARWGSPWWATMDEGE